MAIKSVKNKTRSGSLLIGNPPFIPTDFESIATLTGNGSANNLTFSSIPSTYKHLQIRSLVGLAGGQSFAALEFNADSSATYAWHRLFADGASVGASGLTTRTNTHSTIMTGGNTVPNALAASIVDIHDYASTTKNKTVRTFSGLDTNNNVTDYNFLQLSSALWPSTSAITTIKIISLNSLAFSRTSVFSLYGIKG